MALVVEDGTGLTNANGYVSEADADAYDLVHQNDTVWQAAISSVKELAIQVATQYLDIVYVLQWKGERINGIMSLDWPRFNVETSDGFLLDSDALPQDLVDACVELAIANVNGDELLPDITIANSGSLKRKKSKIGPLESDKEFVSGSVEQQKTYARVDSLIKDLIFGGTELRRG